MKRDVIRRRRTMSFRQIAYDTTAATAAGMAGLGRPSGGVSDRRSEPGGEGHDAQGVDVAAVRVDGRYVAAMPPRWWDLPWVWRIRSKWKSNPDLATCKTRSCLEVT
jgi:hypothetical protein